MSMIQFQPTRDRLLVEPVKGEAKVGGILLPEAARETRPAEAVVVALGPKCHLPVKVGDRIYTERYNGTDVKIGDRSFRLLNPTDVLALIEEN